MICRHYDIYNITDLVHSANLSGLLSHEPSRHAILHGQADELLRKEFVRERSCAVLALLVPKKDKSWHACMDIRRINQITVKY